MRYIYTTLILAYLIFPFASIGHTDDDSQPVNEQISMTNSETTLPTAPKEKPRLTDNDYKIGIQDELDINVIQPDKMELDLTVSPDGTITFPYIGSVDVKGKTAAQVQDEIQMRLADGYLKYPVISVALKQSNSKKFFVYGEVEKPGPYYLDEQATVLKAVSVAGGLSKFGSSSRVKILRPKKSGVGYEIIKIDFKAIMNGNAQDVQLQNGDIVQVEEGIF